MSYTNGLDKPSDYFNTKLTTGTGNSQSVTGLGFQPDWIWGKRRDSTGNNSLFDSVRGITKGLESNSTGAEFTSSDYYTAFGSDGFTIAAGSGGAGNGNGQTAVQWCWKAGTSFTNDASATGIGTIDSAGSVSNDSGFSIVSYTGTGSNGTVKHGLNSVPKMFFVKELSNANSWEVYHASQGAGKNAQLNTNAAFESAGSSRWNSTAPTSTTISIGTDSGVNRSSSNYIAYCFADVKGYSKFSSYVGNGNADGTFVYTGFKPAFVMIKKTTGTDGWWQIEDNKRSPENVAIKAIFANVGDAEYSGANYATDYLSNGFKIRNSTAGSNTSGQVYIYMAFAENPFVASNFVPATAR